MRVEQPTVAVPHDAELRPGEVDRTPGAQDHPVALTRTEFQLLSELATERGRAVSREELMERVWDTAFPADPRPRAEE
ncbi:winged helix-turn-helix domain-containing protein [Modestobacter sp. VKM Ac-2983]|uniref:winged helix-turn-helix domain-containing protein n=1 Tax=Modestobacter sp. VKM Ac-2983 TaxID=3004137 RepID=UPI0022ABAF65|nr:winged helix-turn-helix domain-containing protein [Modestobacter sp. VKM Ac-2983]MCZ2804620.1 winged helix-turn-helix domain-containing protein [Modestobacter sp. VKM Ac-2983]